jgi:hypothetical protein
VYPGATLVNERATLANERAALGTGDDEHRIDDRPG